jgi:hypothetical protein
MTKKIAAHPDTTSQTSTASAAVPTAYMPPAVGAPATPPGWAKSKWARPKEGLRPTETQAEVAGSAAAELQKSTTYVADFGANAPPVATVASNLVTASQWRDEWTSAKNWLAYCAEQRQIWEDTSLEDVATLKPAFDYAVSRDPTITKRYPQTKLLVGSRSQAAARAAATKKAEKAAKEQPAPTPASPSPPGPAATKSVTLN